MSTQPWCKRGEKTWCVLEVGPCQPGESELVWNCPPQQQLKSEVSREHGMQDPGGSPKCALHAAVLPPLQDQELQLQLFPSGTRASLLSFSSANTIDPRTSDLLDASHVSQTQRSQNGTHHLYANLFFLLIVHPSIHPGAQVDNLRLILDFSVATTLHVSSVTKSCGFHHLPPLPLHLPPPSLPPPPSFFSCQTNTD